MMDEEACPFCGSSDLDADAECYSPADGGPLFGPPHCLECWAFMDDSGEWHPGPGMDVPYHDDDFARDMLNERG